MTDAAWVALTLQKHIGGKTLRALLAHFDGDPAAVLAADKATLRRVPGVGGKIADAILSANLDDVRRMLAALAAHDGACVTLRDADYPHILRPLDDAPPTLFTRGLPLREHVHAVAIVGTRQPSTPSAHLAAQFAAELATNGITIVSGLALGIDSAAHLGAISMREGHTLAVLGSGVLRDIYPPENRNLAQAIMRRGTVLCEVSPESGVNTAALVARNRIITGLARAVIIIQTEADGGAMHAARFAHLQGKPVFVVEHRASGNRQLLQNGARPLPPRLESLSSVMAAIAES